MFWFIAFPSIINQ